ncbi:hypothetical protein DNTS_023080 [Danionella cerebrum]|uniref:Rho-GAP domain-containing protein n=1 Tax=Danionella cerebrum TaxID=2873325 RepID=A0A553QZ49_9TELE|nr:hypothetical protein DNTS_023080 [Danionella translucida]
MSLRLPRNWDFSTFRAETSKIVRSKSVIPGEGSPGSTRAGLKRPMEKPLKSGWLKKQRSIVKNWQLRFFGTIPLFSCQVNELPSNADDKFLFELIPGCSSDRERDPYVLMATSQAEMEEWVRCIRKVIGSRSNGVFGKSLSDMMVYEKKFGARLVPILIEKCAEFIKEHGLSEEGIFRLPGQDNQVKHFREAFDAGERPSFPRDTDVHTVASLLKLYLRELPEPVVPWTQYQDFLDSTLTLDANTAAGKEKLEKQISLLPKVNYNLLSYICRFLYEVQQNSKVNKMSVENLATVMGVNLFKPQVEDAISMMKGTPMIQKVMTVMIRHHALFFPPSKDVLPSPLTSKKTKSKKPSNPRSFVGWESAECELSSLSESPEDEDVDTPEEQRRKLLGSSENLSSVDTWPESPRKRTQTLPSIGCPSAGRKGSEPNWDRWSRIQESFNESEEKTFSEDIFKILDLQRVTMFSREQKSENEKAETPKDNNNTDCSTVNLVNKQMDCLKSQAHGTAPLPRSQLSNMGNLSKGTPAVEKKHSLAPAENTDSSSIISRKEGKKEGSKQGGKRGRMEERKQAREEGRKQGMKEGRKQWRNLEQKNRELGAAVAELQAALEAERCSKTALEVLLRTAERSRDDALERNEKLHRQIQGFLNKPPPGHS